jgi:hypothetical protein
MTKHRTLRARPHRALAAALALIAACLLAAAPPAPAANTDQQCNYDNATFNACLRFDYAGSDLWNANVGIDVYMPEQFAREILACKADADFRVRLLGDDGGGGSDDYISSPELKPGWPAAGPLGLAAEFGATISGSSLDEDGGNDTDELYANVSYADCNGNRRSFRTGTVRGHFPF